MATLYVPKLIMLQKGIHILRCQNVLAGSAILQAFLLKKVTEFITNYTVEIK